MPRLPGWRGAALDAPHAGDVRALSALSLRRDSNQPIHPVRAADGSDRASPEQRRYLADTNPIMRVDFEVGIGDTCRMDQLTCAVAPCRAGGCAVTDRLSDPMGAIGGHGNHVHLAYGTRCEHHIAGGARPRIDRSRPRRYVSLPTRRARDPYVNCAAWGFARYDDTYLAQEARKPATSAQLAPTRKAPGRRTHAGSLHDLGCDRPDCL